MNCPYCHTPNHPQSTFCVSCRQNIFVPNFQQQGQYQSAQTGLAPSEKTTNWIIILISFFLFENLINFMVYLIAKGDLFNFGNMFYSFGDGIFTLITIGLTIAFITQTRNKRIKTALIVFASVTAIVKLVNMIF
jgi:hypothetical protein